MNINLNGKWKLYYYDAVEKNINHPSELGGTECIECTVPGNVELDLIKAGKLPEDIFCGESILKGEEYETYDWWYETSFDGVDLNPGEKAVLCFEGVDCIAEYFLNGESIGKSDNMLIPFEFDITDKMHSINKLHIKLSSAVLYANEKESTLYSMGGLWRLQDEITQVRKAAHMVGWDIMPRAISAGIWRNVTLKIYPECYFRQLYTVTAAIYESKVLLQTIYDIKLPRKYYKSHLELKITGRCGDHSFEALNTIKSKSGQVTLEVNNPKLWWPYGYGDANIYEVTAQIISDGKTIATHKASIGIRTVELIRKNVIEDGENCFHFVINGEYIVCKGSNWVPQDVYHSRDISRTPKAMELVSDIGCNMLRCWGGNVYESDEFFDYCDRHGIMVWQDFAMACFLYPQTEEFHKQIAQEAEAIIKRLRQHPSLVVWCGDNECDCIQIPPSGIDPNIANKITREILPAAIIMHDKCRPYLPSSPYIPTEIYVNKGNAPGYSELDMPENHLWGARKYYKQDYYRFSKAHFISETGYHGSPSAESIRKFIDKDHQWPCYNDPQWTLHSSDQSGNPGRVHLMTDQIRQILGEVPDNLEEFCLYSQLSQAEAKKFFIERVRIAKPRTGGIIWWNLLDGWPQMSDAVVDYYYDKKLAYNYIKRSQAPFTMIMGENEASFHPLYVVNDTLEPKKGKYTITDGETGEIIHEGEYEIGRNTYKRIAEIPCDFSQKRLLIIRWNGGYNHYITGSVPYDKKKFKLWNEIIENI